MNFAQPELAGKSVIVTGAGQGIGAATALYLADLGASVIVADIVEENAQRTVASIAERGGRAVARVADVASWEGARSIVAAAVASFGGLDGVVNNAGVLHRGSPFAEVDGEGARRVFMVNLFGTYCVGVAAMQHMAEHGGGSIVNVTSGVQAGMADGAAYSASKGGVASLTYSWALDCKGTGIRVNAISPVATTPMTRGTDEWQRSLGRDIPQREEVDPIWNCPPIAYFLSDRSKDVTGQILRTHGGTLQLVGHPVVVAPELTRESWNAADVAEAVDTVFAEHLPPLGLHAARVDYVPISKVNQVPGVERFAGETRK